MMAEKSCSLAGHACWQVKLAKRISLINFGYTRQECQECMAFNWQGHCSKSASHANLKFHCIFFDAFSWLGYKLCPQQACKPKIKKNLNSKWVCNGRGLKTTNSIRSLWPKDHKPYKMYINQIQLLSLSILSLYTKFQANWLKNDKVIPIFHF